MLMMNGDDAAERARQRDLARRGYDAISLAYRSDDGNAATSSAEDVSRYAGWVELASLLRHGARVVDLGCGAGIPATRELASYGLWGARRRFLGGPAPPGSAARPRGTAGAGRYRQVRAAARDRCGRSVVLCVDPGAG